MATITLNTLVQLVADRSGASMVLWGQEIAGLGQYFNWKAAPGTNADHASPPKPLDDYPKGKDWASNRLLWG